MYGVLVGGLLTTFSGALADRRGRAETRRSESRTDRVRAYEELLAFLLHHDELVKEIADLHESISTGGEKPDRSNRNALITADELLRGEVVVRAHASEKVETMLTSDWFPAAWRLLRNSEAKTASEEDSEDRTQAYNEAKDSVRSAQKDMRAISRKISDQIKKELHG